MTSGKKQLTVWLKDEELDVLDGVARQNGLPRATVLRMLIAEAEGKTFGFRQINTTENPNPPGSPPANVTATVSRKVMGVPSSFPKAEATLDGLPESPTVPPGRGFDLERWKKMNPGKELPK